MPFVAPRKLNIKEQINEARTDVTLDTLWLISLLIATFANLIAVHVLFQKRKLSLQD